MASNQLNINFEYVQSAFDSVQDAVVIVDENRRIIAVNSAFEQIFGYSQDEILDRETALLYAFGKDFKQAGKPRYNLESETEFELYEADYLCKDGSIFSGETVNSVVKDDAGNILGYMRAIRDLTFQKKNEEELKILLDRLQLLVKITTDERKSIDSQILRGIKLTTELLDLDVGIVSSISGDIYTVEYFYPEDSSLEKGVQFKLEEMYCSITCEVNDVVSIEHMAQSSYHEHPWYSKFGMESYIGIPLSVNGNRFGTVNFSSAKPRRRSFRKADKEMLRLLGAWLSALLEQKKMQEELRDSREKFHFMENQLRERNRELEILRETTNKIYSVLGHDLKTPLSTIIGMVDLLSEEIDSDSQEVLQYLKFVNLSAKKMAGMVDDLFNWALTQRGNMKIHLKQIKVQELIKEVFELLEPTAKEKDIEIALVGSDDFIVETDEQMVATIIRNLLSNAIKFSRPRGVIEVSCSKGNTAWSISVKDKGSGMSEEIRANLFSEENHPSTYGTNGEKGSGIGLLLCNQLAQHCNGKIEVKSELNVGSEFILRIPVDAEVSSLLNK